MSSDIKKYVPLIQVVAMAADEDRTNDLDRLWVLGFRALAFIYHSMTAEPKSVRLPVGDNYTVVFPEDCIDWTKIGVMGSDGKVATLAINKSISKYKSTNPDRVDKIGETVHTDTIGDECFFNFIENGICFHVGTNNSRLLQPGECTVDETNRRIVLPFSFGFDEIMLEYISSPDKDKSYQIEQCYQEAVIAFIRWKNKTGNRQEFYAALSDARRMDEPIRLQVLNQVIREGRGWKIKS